MQFENEELQILEYLNRKWSALEFEAAPLLLASKLGKQSENFKALEAVHKKLWNLESERRVLMTSCVIGSDRPSESEYYEVIGRNAEKTTKLNDERQRLIQEVNKGFGVDEVEKLYSLESEPACAH